MFQKIFLRHNWYIFHFYFGILHNIFYLLLTPASHSLIQVIYYLKGVLEDYLNHHVKLAGISNRIFSEEAIFAIHQGSGGLLRRANSLAKTVLVACAMDGNHTVSAEHVRIASTEIM